MVLMVVDEAMWAGGNGQWKFWTEVGLRSEEASGFMSSKDRQRTVRAQEHKMMLVRHSGAIPSDLKPDGPSVQATGPNKKGAGTTSKLNL